MSLVVKEAETDLGFRNYMDKKDKERRPHNPIPEVEYWNEVPADLKTKSQWKRNGRRVPKETPARLLKSADDYSSRSVRFYSWDQTRPYTPSSRTKALWRYCDIFYRNSNKHDYIFKSGKYWDEEVEPDWITNQISEDSALGFDFRTLSESTLRTHVNHKHVVGVKNRTGRTNWISIDLDFHNRNADVFLKQAEVLLQRFHRGTWHYQVKDQDVTGIHFFFVFKEARDLDFFTRKLRRILEKLDRLNPGLAQEAKNNGMKTLGELEIYPTQTHGFRLPLARGRTLMLDRYVRPIKKGKRLVGDLETYINWLDDPNRKHMPREHVLQYLQTFLSMGSTGAISRVSRKGPVSASVGQHPTWKNRLKRNLIEFWRDGNSNQIPLNTHIVVLARISWFWGYTSHEIESQIRRMLRDLPDSALSSSQRLLNRDWRSIDRVVRTSVKYAQDNLRQKDPQPSTEKLLKVVQNLRTSGFDPLTPESWPTAIASNHQQLPINWQSKEKNRMVAFLRKPLFCRNDQMIIRFVEEVIGLTQNMKGRAWGIQYFSKWCGSRFPALSMKRKNKLVTVLRVLQEEGILKLDHKGSVARGCSQWSLGEVSLKVLDRSGKQSRTNLVPSEDLGKRWTPSVPNQSYTLGNQRIKSQYETRTTQIDHKATYRRHLTSTYYGITFDSLHTNHSLVNHLASSGTDPPG